MGRIGEDIAVKSWLFRSGVDPEKLQGEGHESQWCRYLYPKFKNSMDFSHLILVVAYFQFFTSCFSNFFWQACGAPAKPVVPLISQWCP